MEQPEPKRSKIDVGERLDLLEQKETLEQEIKYTNEIINSLNEKQYDRNYKLKEINEKLLIDDIFNEETEEIYMVNSEFKKLFDTQDKLEQIKETKYIIEDLELHGIIARQKWVIIEDLNVANQIEQDLNVTYDVDPKGYTLNLNNSTCQQGEFHAYADWSKIESLITSKLNEISAMVESLNHYEKKLNYREKRDNCKDNSIVVETDGQSYLITKYYVKFIAIVPKINN